MLKGNETKEYKVTFTENGSDIIVKPSDDNTNKNDTETSNSEKKSNVDTGDSLTNMMIIGIAGITVLSCITAVFLKKKRQLKKLFIFALISAMALSVTSTKAVYAENSAMAEKHIYLTQPFIYDNKTYEMDIDVKYMISSDETISNGEITREEWITQLLSVFEFSINDREYSFTDYAEAKNPKTIETAIQYSVIDIKDNEAFHPTEYATREFVAYSAIKALRFINTSKGVLQCSDQAILQYPDEVYLAVQNGMFNLIDNQFRPNQYVSKEETNQVIKIIHEILNSCKINDNNQNHIDYQDNVKEINDSLENILSHYLGIPVTLIPCAGGDDVASQREQWNDGTNTLCIAPGVVVVYNRNNITNEVLRVHGIKVIEMSSAELSRGRGGPRCMSMPLSRED